jgi:hypothetical protein
MVQLSMSENRTDIQMVARVKFITKFDHFIYKSCQYNFLYKKTVQLSMSCFQVTGYSSDVQLSNSVLAKIDRLITGNVRISDVHCNQSGNHIVFNWL